MALLQRFDTPAGLRDAPAGSKFYDSWSNALADEIDNLTHRTGFGAFYDPTVTNVDVVGEKAIVWMGLPRRLMLPGRRDDKWEVYRLADEGGPPPQRQREHQDEYFEWRAERNVKGKITKVTFVTEFRSYYQKLWECEPKLVARIYSELLGRQISPNELRDAGGSYDVYNKWNTTHGIVHYIQEINTVTAAVGLCRDAARGGEVLGRDNYESRPPSTTRKLPSILGLPTKSTCSCGRGFTSHFAIRSVSTSPIGTIPGSPGPTVVPPQRAGGRLSAALARWRSASSMRCRSRRGMWSVI